MSYNLNFRERRAKIAMLQKRAHELEDEREELEDRGLNPYQVSQALEHKRKLMTLGAEIVNKSPRNPLTD